jgi:hypothetical protein
MIEFIFGMLFATYALPLLDSITGLIATWIESLKGKSSIKIAEYNQKVTALSDDSPKHAIGFAIQSEDEYDED